MGRPEITTQLWEYRKGPTCNVGVYVHKKRGHIIYLVLRSNTELARQSPAFEFISPDNYFCNFKIFFHWHLNFFCLYSKVVFFY